MSEISQFSHRLAELLPRIGSNEFFSLLIDTIKAMAPIDEATVIVYTNVSLPVIEFAIPDSWTQPNLDIFLKGAFLLDPYYLAATKQRKTGFFRLRDLAPSGFKQSEYYRIYYGSSGLQDECGYLIALRDGGFINIALGRTQKPAFVKAQLSLLSDITPVIDVLCHSHWQAKALAQETEFDLRQPLETALSCFGSSKLTKREREVINMILLGHTTKTVAEQLEISSETVKLHRKHAYAKLDINTQSELFYIFIDSLMSTEGYHGGDPLMAYFQRPRKNTQL